MQSYVGARQRPQGLQGRHKGWAVRDDGQGTPSMPVRTGHGLTASQQCGDGHGTESGQVQSVRCPQLETPEHFQDRDRANAQSRGFGSEWRERSWPCARATFVLNLLRREEGGLGQLEGGVCLREGVLNV